jgi:hypothetical protein
MNAYVYSAALYCEPCGEAIKAERAAFAPDPAAVEAYGEAAWDSDDYPKGPYADGGGEADYPVHCFRCNRFLENPLTTHGEAALRELVGPEPEWRQFYSYLWADGSADYDRGFDDGFSDGGNAVQAEFQPVRDAAEAALYWLEAEALNPGQTTPAEIIRVLRAALAPSKGAGE